MMRRIYDYLDMDSADFFGFAIAVILVLSFTPPLVVALWRWAVKP